MTGYGLDGPGFESRGGARFSAPVQTGPVAHPASCTTGTGSSPRVKSGRGVTLTPHPLRVPWSWKSRAIRLLPLWAVRPVQSLSVCTRVQFTFTRIGECVLDLSVSGYGPVTGCFKQNIDIFRSIKWGEFYCDSGLAANWVQTRHFPARKCVATLFVYCINIR